MNLHVDLYQLYYILYHISVEIKASYIFYVFFAK